jgi:16S rRNA (cytidine1402-2'-O)-methyltransferase
MTFRAIKVLKEADLILAEDTRTSGKLLKHFEITTHMHSHHMHNEHKTVENVIARLKGGETIALISDAGTPAISDPGFLLVREAVKNGVDVLCLPGATALIPALVVSGLPTDSFAFLGFLPQKKGRQTAIKKLLEETRTVALYESPHRIHKLVEELIALGGGEKEISISREISKKFEETIRGKVLEVSERIKGKDLKGEMVVVIH